MSNGKRLKIGDRVRPSPDAIAGGIIASDRRATVVGFGRERWDLVTVAVDGLKTRRRYAAKYWTADIAAEADGPTVDVAGDLAAAKEPK